MLNVVRYGILEKMHPEVKKISTQVLSKRNDADTSFNSKDIPALREEQKTIRERIEKLSKDPQRHNTVAGNQMDILKKRLNIVQETINKKVGKNDPHIKRDETFKLIEGANIVCTTISSSLNLKQ